MNSETAAPGAIRTKLFSLVSAFSQMRLKSKTLPSHILKKYSVPVGYRVEAAPMDSGCSTTNLSHEDGFSKRLPSDSTVNVADFNSYNVKFEGPADLLVFTDPSTHASLHLQRCLHVPKIRTLFSVHSLVAQGCDIRFKHKKPLFGVT